MRLISVQSFDDDVYDRQRKLWDQSRLLASSVLVLGAGALGNELVKNLVQIGVGKIYVVDFDHVVMSNLNRCIFFTRSDAREKRRKVDALASRASKLNQDSKVIPIHKDVRKLKDKAYSNVDVILTTLDNLGARLVANSKAYSLGKPLVDGGIEGFIGHVQVVLPPISPCLECSLTDKDFAAIWERLSCGGEALGLESRKLPYIPMTAAVVAGVMVNEFVKVIFGLESFRRNGRWNERIGTPLVGQALFFDGANGKFMNYGVIRRSDCLACH